VKGTRIEKEIYHLEIPASGGALDEVGSGADVVDDRPLDPRDHQVSSFRVHLRRKQKANRNLIKNHIHTSHHHCAAVIEGMGGIEPAHLVLDSLDAVEDDGAVAALHVVEAVEDGVEPRAAKQRHLHEPAPARRRARHLRSLEAHLAGGGRRRRRRPGFS
jgi:hypothetical protein